MSELYRQLLIIFTRGLCEFESDCVENWVNRDYFPAKDCIDVCRQMKNPLAEARLVEKMGD